MPTQVVASLLAVVLAGGLAIGAPEPDGLPLDFAQGALAEPDPQVAPTSAGNSAALQACPPELGERARSGEEIGAGEALQRLFAGEVLELADRGGDLAQALPPNPDDDEEGETALSPADVQIDRVQRLTRAHELLDVEGSADAADGELVAAELARFPLAILGELEANGVRIAVARGSVTDVREDLRGVRPRGWPPGSTWDSVPGLYEPSRKRVIIATRGHEGGAPYVPPFGDGHGSFNLVLHETGHAIDKAERETYRSATSDFTAARDADRSRLGGYERQSGSAGREETYAESLARYYGGDATLASDWPTLYAYWRGDPLGGEGNP